MNKVFTISKNQYLYIKNLLNEKNFVPILETTKYLIEMHMPQIIEFFITLFKKDIIIAELGFPVFSSPLVDKRIEISKRNIRRLLSANYKIKLNPAFVDFYPILQKWFEEK